MGTVEHMDLFLSRDKNGFIETVVKSALLLLLLQTHTHTHIFAKTGTQTSTILTLVLSLSCTVLTSCGF